MMNSPWIPHTTTTVGLLSVGLSRTNFDELSKWIVVQLDTSRMMRSESLALIEWKRASRQFSL